MVTYAQEMLGTIHAAMIEAADPTTELVGDMDPEYELSCSEVCPLNCNYLVPAQQLRLM